MKGDRSIQVKDLKSKLSSVWGVRVDSWLITLMGKGFYSLNLKSDDLKSKVFTRGTIHIKPGIFRISQWSQIQSKLPKADELVGLGKAPRPPNGILGSGLFGGYYSRVGELLRVDEK